MGGCDRRLCSYTALSVTPGAMSFGVGRGDPGDRGGCYASVARRLSGSTVGPWDRGGPAAGGCATQQGLPFDLLVPWNFVPTSSPSGCLPPPAFPVPLAPSPVAHLAAPCLTCTNVVIYMLNQVQVTPAGPCGARRRRPLRIGPAARWLWSHHDLHAFVAAFLPCLCSPLFSCLLCTMCAGLPACEVRGPPLFW